MAVGFTQCDYHPQITMTGVIWPRGYWVNPGTYATKCPWTCSAKLEYKDPPSNGWGSPFWLRFDKATHHRGGHRGHLTGWIRVGEHSPAAAAPDGISILAPPWSGNWLRHCWHWVVRGRHSRISKDTHFLHEEGPQARALGLAPFAVFWGPPPFLL